MHFFLKYEERITFSLLTFSQCGHSLDVSIETWCSFQPWISTTSVTSHGNIMSRHLICIVICVSVHVVVTACRRVSSYGTHFCTGKKRDIRDRHDCTIVTSSAVHVDIWFLSMTCLFLQLDISIMSWMTSELLEPLFLFFLTRPFRSFSNPAVLTTSALLPNFSVTPDLNNVVRLPMDGATSAGSSRALFLFIYRMTVSVYFWYLPVLFCQCGLFSPCSVSLRLGWSPVLFVCSTH